MMNDQAVFIDNQYSIPTYDTMQALIKAIMLVENLGCESGFSLSCVHLRNGRLNGRNHNF